MARCPNCGQKTGSDDYCQWCNYPILRGSSKRRQKAEKKAKKEAEKAAREKVKQDAIEAQKAKVAEERAKKEAEQAAREKAKQDLAKAQQDLRQVLTLRQEATVVLMGMLD